MGEFARRFYPGAGVAKRWERTAPSTRHDASRPRALGKAVGPAFIVHAGVVIHDDAVGASLSPLRTSNHDRADSGRAGVRTRRRHLTCAGGLRGRRLRRAIYRGPSWPPAPGVFAGGRMSRAHGTRPLTMETSRAPGPVRASSPGPSRWPASSAAYRRPMLRVDAAHHRTTASMVTEAWAAALAAHMKRRGMRGVWSQSWSQKRRRDDPRSRACQPAGAGWPAAAHGTPHSG